MITKIRATRNFTVGPSKEIVIREDDIREVDISTSGHFVTVTNRNTFFGTCHISRGWEKV